MLNVLQSRAVGPSFVLDRSGSFSFVWSRFISRSMILLPPLKPFPLPDPVILLAQLPSPVLFTKVMDLLHLHCIGMVFALDSFANELSTRQIEKKPFTSNMRNSSFLEEQKDKLKRKKTLWDSNSGILNLKLSTEYLQFKT